MQNNLTQFAKSVDLLKSHKISKAIIAEKLGIISTRTQKPDHTILTKLVAGLVKTHNKRSVVELHQELITHEDFKKYFSNDLINITTYDHIFLFYYFSFHGIVKFAIIGISEKNSSLSRLIYLDKTEDGAYKESVTHHILTQTYKQSETLDLTCNNPRKKSGSTFLSIHLGDKSLAEIKVSFASYCGAMATDQNQYGGIGVIERITHEIFKDKMTILAKEGSPASVVNMLYRKRYDISRFPISPEMYDDIDALFGTQKEPLKLIQGYWRGYYLRRVLNGDSDKSGGIVKVLLEIQPSGLAAIRFIDAVVEDMSTIDMLLKNKKVVEYKGVFKFPIPDSCSITAGEFEYNKQQSISRLQLRLKYKSNKLVGMLSGWRTIDLGFYSTPIYFEQMNSDEIGTLSNNEILIKHHMTQYFRSTYQSFKKQITELQRLQKDIFEGVEECFDDC